jgi:hypothetical protein
MEGDKSEVLPATDRYPEGDYKNNRKNALMDAHRGVGVGPLTPLHHRHKRPRLQSPETASDAPKQVTPADSIAETNPMIGEEKNRSFFPFVHAEERRLQYAQTLSMAPQCEPPLDISSASLPIN